MKKSSLNQIILLVVLCFVLVGMIVIMYLIVPVWNKRVDLEEKITEEQDKYDLMYVEAMNADILPIHIEETKTAIDEAVKPFYDVMNTEQVDMLLLSLLTKGGLRVRGLSVSEAVPIESSGFSIPETTIDLATGTTMTVDGVSGIKYSTASYSVTAKYSQIVDIIATLNKDVSIYINDVSFSGTLGKSDNINDAVEATITLSVLMYDPDDLSVLEDNVVEPVVEEADPNDTGEDSKYPDV